MSEQAFDLDKRRRSPVSVEVTGQVNQVRLDETVALLAAYRLPVTEEGKARARKVLAEADERMTAERWQTLRAQLGLAQPAA
jgi:hypothetical protein